MWAGAEKSDSVLLRVETWGFLHAVLVFNCICILRTWIQTSVLQQVLQENKCKLFYGGFSIAPLKGSSEHCGVPYYMCYMIHLFKLYLLGDQENIVYIFRSVINCLRHRFSNFFPLGPQQTGHGITAPHHWVQHIPRVQILLKPDHTCQNQY